VQAPLLKRLAAQLLAAEVNGSAFEHFDIDAEELLVSQKQKFRELRAALFIGDFHDNS
jgi:hypothetical protein